METKAIQKYEQQSLVLLDDARSIMIVDEVTRELATEFRSNVRKTVKAIEAELRPDIDAAHTLHKNLLSRLQKLTAPFKEAQSIVDKEIGRDLLERDRIRQEEERKVRIEAGAERKRQEAVLAVEVAERIEEGDMEAAEVLSDVQVVVEPSIPVPETQKTVMSEAGSTTVRRDIKVELVDKLLVIEAVAAQKLPIILLDVNMGAAKRYAKAGELTTMPGFAITDDVVVSGRTR